MAEEEQKTQHKEEPIIIKKRLSIRKSSHYGGAWKVAYADFVTAMMAMFIVLWILGQNEQIKMAVAAYFKNPGAFNFMNGKRTIPVDLNLKPGEGEGKGNKKQDFYFVILRDQRDTIVNQANEKLRKIAIQDSAKAAEKLKSMGEQFKKYLDAQIKERPEMQDILKSVKIELTDEGLRIELLESKDALFFEIGSAIIKDRAKSVLTELAGEIGKLPNYVDIEGHTDSRKYSEHALYSNWELSTDRANAARRLLEANGFWEGQVGRVAGFADRKLRNPANPFDLTNRRISILVRQLKSSNFIKGG